MWGRQAGGWGQGVEPLLAEALTDLPSSRGCPRPSLSGRRAVTLLVPLWGRGLREASAPLPGLNVRILGSMGERAAYQRLTGGEEGQQVMGDARGAVRYLSRSPHHLLVS